MESIYKMANNMKFNPKLSWWMNIITIMVIILACGDNTIHKGDFDLPPQKSTPTKQKKRNTNQLKFNFSQCITGDLPTAQASPDIGTKPDYYVPDGQKVQFTHKRIESSSELRDLLKTEAGFSSNATISGKAQFNNQDSLMISNNERYYYYKIEVENPAVIMKNIRLTDDAYHLLKQKGRKVFTQRCGTEAKIGYKSGGTLSQVIRMSKKQQDSNASIDTLIQASGLKFGAGGKIETTDETDTSKINVDIFTQWQGGFGEHAYTSIQDLRTMSEQWPHTVAEHGVLVETISLPFAHIIGHLKDPYEDLITNEIIWFQAELLRLNRMKSNIIALPPEGRTIPTQDLQQLESLILMLSKKINACEHTTQLDKCQDMNLLFEAKDFVISTTMTSPLCGSKPTAPPPEPPEVCEHKLTESWRTIRDASCPVEEYNQGPLFQEVFSFKGKKPSDKRLAKKFDKICDQPDVTKHIEFTGTHTTQSHYRLCYPKSGKCIFDKTYDRIYYNYKLTCTGSDRRFGVLRYQFCPVKEHTINKICKPAPAATATASPPSPQYLSCLVALDH